jgi:hypothetical protein
MEIYQSGGATNAQPLPFSWINSIHHWVFKYFL